jgi:AMMECR1 domain-containing protein
MLLKYWAVFFFVLFLATVSPISAQERTIQPALPPLTGAQRNVLLQIAREAIDATLENRESRAATVEARLNEPQPIVVTVYVDGKLRGRAWSLKSSTPLFENAREITYQAIDEPRTGGEMLSLEELARAEVAVAILGKYTKAADDREVPPKSAVIIYNGFTEWMALPGDVESGKAADLLSYACEQAGLRPNVWLLPQTSIFWATVEEVREKRAEMPGVSLGDSR